MSRRTRVIGVGSSCLRGLIPLLFCAALSWHAYAGVTTFLTTVDSELSAKDWQGDAQASFAGNRGLLDGVAKIVREDVERALRTQPTGGASPYGGKVYRADGGQTSVETDPDSHPLHVHYLGKQGEAHVYLGEDGRLASVIVPRVMRLYAYADGSIAALCQYDASENERWEIGDPGYRLRFLCIRMKTAESWLLSEHDANGAMVARWTRLDTDGIKESDFCEERLRADGSPLRRIYIFSKATDPSTSAVAVENYAEDGSHKEDHIPVDRAGHKFARKEYDADGALTAEFELEPEYLGYPVPDFAPRRILFLDAMYPGSVREEQKGTFYGLPGYYLPGVATSGQLRLDVDGYPSRLVDWELGKDDVFRHVQIDPGAYSGDKGSLSIETTPTVGAEVTVNGTLVGTTPCLYEYHGRDRVFDIRIRKGEAVLEKTHTPPEPAAEELRIDFDAEPRTYAISTTPAGARVLVNGAEVGATPCSFEAIGATQEVEVSLHLYKTIQRTYTEAPGAHIEESFTLETDWNARREAMHTAGVQVGLFVLWPGKVEAETRLGPYYGATARLGDRLRREPVTLDLGLDLGFAGKKPEVTTDAWGVTLDASAALGLRTWIRTVAVFYAKAAIMLGFSVTSDEVAETPLRLRLHLGPELGAGFRVQGAKLGLFAEGAVLLGWGPVGLSVYPGLRTGVFVPLD